MANPAPRAPRMRDPTPEDLFEAYRYKNLRRSGLPIPKKAPKIEAKEFPFNKTRDATGSVLGDLLKRGIFQVEDLIGDTRRTILHQLPMNDNNKQLIKNLNVKLAILEAKLTKKISEMERDTGITHNFPFHFQKPPALKD